MSILKEAGWQDATRAAKEVVLATVGWILSPIIALTVRRDKNLILVIGRKGFSDNSKHLFLAATAHDWQGETCRAVFLSGEDWVVEEIRRAGGEAMLHPSYKSVILLIKAGAVASDVSAWYEGAAVPLTWGAARIQMWHGAPLKSIELRQYRERYAPENWVLDAVLFAYKRFVGRYPVYDAVVATSNGLIEDAFKESFLSRNFFPFGYPRNDVLSCGEEYVGVKDRLNNINIDDRVTTRVKEEKESGRKIVLYVPTFRKSMGVPFSSVLDIDALESFCEKRNLLFVVKLHPFLSGGSVVNESDVILEHSPTADVYPLLSDVDVLVTDYSSIFFDFLLLDRPVVFFCHDLDWYLESDRHMYFDYHAMTPGDHAYEQRELQDAIVRSLTKDEYAGARKKIRDYVHDYKDGCSGKRVVDICLRLAREKR